MTLIVSSSNARDGAKASSAEDCMENGMIHRSSDIKASTSAKVKLSCFTTVLAAGLLVASIVAFSALRPGAIHPSTDMPSMSTESSTLSSRRLQSNNELMVGAYYYPWHGGHFKDRGGFLRRALEPQQLPTLGFYDDRRPEVIAQHLKWSKQANLGLWITSWWSPGGLVDTTTKDVILKHEDLGDMKIALHYETLGRVRESEDFDTKRVPSDMRYICETYFGHENYYRINGRPVMFMYLTRYMESAGKIEEVTALMRTAANKCGESLYIVGDHTFRSPPREDQAFMPFQYLDAVTNYDLYGAIKADTPYAGPEKVDSYYAGQRVWRERAAAHGCAYVSAAAPGYNDRGVRLEADHMALSRRLTEDAAEGSLFEYALDHARDIVDESAGSLLVINSFNEWHEDTQLEPVDRTETETSDPEDMTNGVKYQGYGELYLDILSDKTAGFIPTPFKSARTYQV